MSRPPSILTTTTLSPDDLAIILVCMAEVNITDQREKKAALHQRLSRMLQKMAPDFYDELIRIGKIERAKLSVAREKVAAE